MVTAHERARVVDHDTVMTLNAKLDVSHDNSVFELLRVSYRVFAVVQDHSTGLRETLQAVGVWMAIAICSIVTNPRSHAFVWLLR
jgi:hypothetical protein